MVFALGALVIVFVVCRVVPNVFYLFIPVILLQEYLFCLGLGMLLAQGCVFFRDIQHIYNAVLTAWMYLTPLFYPITLLPGKSLIIDWYYKKTVSGMSGDVPIVLVKTFFIPVNRIA